MEEGGYGEEIEETGGGELEEGDEIYDPNKEEYEEEEEELEYVENVDADAQEEEGYDEKEFIREAADIGSSVRIQ